MNIDINFSTNKSLGNIQEFTKDFFIKHGYHLVKSIDEYQEFSKGSELKNFISFNPLNWKSIVKVYYNRDGELNIDIKCVYEIDTSGQTVTEKEEEIWKKFSQNYQMAVKEGKYIDSNELGRQMKKEILSIVFNALGIALGMALITGVIVGLSKNYFGYKLILTPFTLFTIGITMSYVFFKIGKIKK